MGIRWHVVLLMTSVALLGISFLACAVWSGLHLLHLLSV